LIQASENGKQAVCVVELKARFDERRNIGWAKKGIFSFSNVPLTMLSFAGTVLFLLSLVLAAAQGVARVVAPGSAPRGVATLVILAGLMSLPLGGVQIWVARHVAEYESTDDRDAVHWFVRRVGLVLAAIGSTVTLLLLALVYPIQHALAIASPAAVALTALTAFPAILSPVTWGLAQGLQRFTLVALIYATGPVVRIGLMIAAFSIGLHAGGAMLATFGSMMVALVLPLWILREWISPAPSLGGRIDRWGAIRSLLPVLVGLLAITVLTSVDVVGIATDYCVRATAADAARAGLATRVLLSLSAGVAAATTQAALASLREAGVRLVGTLS